MFEKKKERPKLMYFQGPFKVIRYQVWQPALLQVGSVGCKGLVGWCERVVYAPACAFGIRANRHGVQTRYGMTI